MDEKIGRHFYITKTTLNILDEYKKKNNCGNLSRAMDEMLQQYDSYKNKIQDDFIKELIQHLSEKIINETNKELSCIKVSINEINLLQKVFLEIINGCLIELDIDRDIPLIEEFESIPVRNAIDHVKEKIIFMRYKKNQSKY